MHIRSYTDPDWCAVRDIYDLSKPDEMRGTVDPAAILPLESDPGALQLFHDSQIVVAEDNGTIIGFGGHKATYISWMFVHPAHRRRGIARALLATILGRVTGPVTLNVVPTNRAARALCESVGFVVAKEFMGTFNGREVHVMTLPRPAVNAR